MKKIFFYLRNIAIFFGLMSWPVLVLSQPAHQPVGEPVGSSSPLSLEETTRLALQNNFDIQLAKYDTWISRTREGLSESVYDTIIDAQVSYQDDQQERSSSLLGTKSLENDYRLGFSKKLPTGTTLSTGLENIRNWSDSQFVTVNPSHESLAWVSITQELGRNFFGIADRGNVKITRLEIENTGFSSLDKIESYIADVQKAYWELVLQTERVRIAQEAVELARQLFDLHQEKISHGLVEKPDALASEANYQKRVNELLLANNQLQTKENILRLLLNIADDQAPLIPTENLDRSTVPQPLEQSLKAAFENRRDYQKARNTIDLKDIQLEVKRNQLWPEINLTASFQRNGIADDFKKSFSDISAQDNPEVFTGLTLHMPLENHAAESAWKAASLEKAREIVTLKKLERQIVVGVADQVRHCNVLKEIAVNAANVAELTERKFREEEKRFNTGRSSTDTLIRFQEDLLLARWEAAAALYGYQAALIDLKVQEGTLLNAYWNGEL